MTPSFLVEAGDLHACFSQAPLLGLAPLLVAIAAPVHAQSVALLPAVGGTAEPERRSIDGALRQALKGEGDVQVQSPADTKRHLLSLAEMGLVCVPEDVPCLSKLGIAADVAFVMVPVAEGDAGKGFDVQIEVIDVAQSALVRTVRATVGLSDDAKVKALVREALGRKGAVTQPPDPPPDDPPPDHPPDDPPPDPPPGDGPSPATIGFAVAGVGGALAAVGFVGGALSEAAYAGYVGGADAKTRQDVVRPVGVALWITGAVGLAGLGSGLVIALAMQSKDAQATE